MSTPPRAYRSTLRATQAEETRRRIIGAAAQLMQEQGYRTTTVEEIARAAGVSPQTVYTSCGGKPAIAHLVYNSVLDGEGRVTQQHAQETVVAVLEEPDPRAKIELYSANALAILQRLGPAQQMLRDAVASGGAQSASARKAAELDHLAGSRGFAEHLAHEGALRSGITTERAAEEIYIASTYDTYERLTQICGWTDDAYREWLVERLCTALLPQG